MWLFNKNRLKREEKELLGTVADIIPYYSSKKLKLESIAFSEKEAFTCRNNDQLSFDTVFSRGKGEELSTVNLFYILQTKHPLSVGNINPAINKEVGEILTKLRDKTKLKIAREHKVTVEALVDSYYSMKKTEHKEKLKHELTNFILFCLEETDKELASKVEIENIGPTIEKEKEREEEILAMALSLSEKTKNAKGRVN